MSNDEKLILDYLKQFPGEFVSSLEIARRAGSPRRYNIQPGWASVVLKRLETEAVVERDFKGRYRIKPKRAKIVHEPEELAPEPKEAAAETKAAEPVALYHYWLGPSVVQADDDQPFAAIFQSLAYAWPSSKKVIKT